MASRCAARRAIRHLVARNPASSVTRTHRMRLIVPASTTTTGAPFLPEDRRIRWFSSQGEKEEEKKDGLVIEEVGTTAAEEEAIEDETEEEAEEEPAPLSREEKWEAEEEPAPLSREEELEAEVKGLKNQLLRSLAEQENTRNIARRDVESARQFAIKSFAKSLLDVSDNLTRALEAVPEEVRADKEGNPVLATLYEGIELTDKGLTKAFVMNGLVKYGEPGDAFDPNKHEALYEYVDPEKEAGTVGQVMKPGFMLNKRVLRPAEVGVVKRE